MGVMPPAASLPPMPVISSGNISAPVLHGFASSANGNVIFGHPTDPSHGDDARHLVICNKWAISNAARRHVFGGWRHASATATAWSRRSWSSSSLKCSSCNLKPGWWSHWRRNARQSVARHRQGVGEPRWLTFLPGSSAIYSALVGALSTHFPQKVPEFMAYQSIIVRSFREFDGDGWYQYDRVFRRQVVIT